MENNKYESEECIKMIEYMNNLSNDEVMEIYRDRNLYSEDIKEVIKNITFGRGLIKAEDEEKSEEKDKKESIISRMKYFIIQVIIFYTATISSMGLEKFTEEMPLTDNIKMIIIMLVIADIIYILKKKIKWKEAIKIYLIWKFIIFSIVDIFFK